MAVVITFVIPSLASAGVKIQKVQENKVVVSYSSEEAFTDLGRIELERQIRCAASEGCGPQRVRNAGSLAEYVSNRACFEEAVTTALAKVSPVLERPIKRSEGLNLIPLDSP
ncbi:MAG: UrcA family protein [Pseudohongiellaceae bacterium]|jgi:UrcA family protein